MNIGEFYTRYFRSGNVSTDSRKIKTGDIFVALKGDNFDGNEYVFQALKKGARIAVTEKTFNTGEQKLLKVDDTLCFLQELANYRRKKLKIKIIGLTGSNGKTTTKELLYSVLKQKFRVEATEGNLNNHIGVPLTLLSLKSDTEIAIVEMGANHPGEIAALCHIAEPDCGLITNIGRAHLEGFGNYEGVITAKSELYRFLQAKNGRIYFNKEDPTLTGLLDKYTNIVPYNSPGGICHGKIVNSFPTLSFTLFHHDDRSLHIITQLFGEYNLVNILSAASVGLDMGVSPAEIKTAIEEYYPSNYRSQIVRLPDLLLILDCYNANPSSMKLALEDFARLESPKKYLIIGGMKELGEFTHEEHLKIGEQINCMELTGIYMTGEEFRQVGVKKSVYCADSAEIIGKLSKEDLRGSAVLIKGSRANRLEKIGDHIKKAYS